MTFCGLTIYNDNSLPIRLHTNPSPFYWTWPFTELWVFPWNICEGCCMTTGDAYSSGHLVPMHLGFAYVLLVETNSLPEVVVSRQFLYFASYDCYIRSHIWNAVLTYIQLFEDILKISSNELKISSNHLKISSNHLKISSNVLYLKISSNELKISSNELKISSNDLKISSNDLKISSNELKISSNGTICRYL